MPMVTYPLNNIEYAAEDAELFHSTRTSGVYATNSFDYSVTGADNTVIIGTGIAWIKNGDFSGKVVAQKESVSLDLGLPDPNYPRIDAIVIQFDANKNASEILVKKGTAGTNPVSPSVVRTESVYELHLYHIRRDAGALTISAGNITDLRLNANYCGLMADSVTEIDTSAINLQITELIANLSEEIKKVKDESAFWLKEDVIPLGNGGTGATTAADARNAIQAAPAGYGLGENSGQNAPYGTADQCTKGGFWIASTGLPHTGVWHGITIPSDDKKVQIAVDVTNRKGTAAVRVLADGAGEWEYLNPPMMLATEYRTAEHYEGKPVYAKLIDLGAMPNNTTKQISDVIPWGSTIISADAFFYKTNTDGSFVAASIGDSASGEAIWFNSGSKTIYIKTISDASDRTAKIIVKYTKA